MALREKVFIVGISGLVGHALAMHLRRKYLVAGAYFRNQVGISGVQCYPVSVKNLDILDVLVRRQRPNHIICAAGLSDKKELFDQPKIANLVNVALPGQLAITASRMGARFIHIGCADVFDGESGGYAEDSNAVTLVDELGKQKLSAQTFIRAKTLESVTLRVGKVVSVGHPGRPTFFDKIRFAAAGSSPLDASKNKVHSFLSTSSLGAAVDAVMQADLAVKHYTFHVGGATMSELDFARGWFSLLEADQKLVRAVDTDFPRNISLDSALMENTFPDWKPETKNELYLKLLEGLTPAVGIKKWQKTLQSP